MTDLEEEKKRANGLYPHIGQDNVDWILALITEVERLRKELTTFYQQDNQEHRLIAQIERLEWWKEHGQKLRNAIAEMDNSATTDQEIEKAPLKMKDELKRLRELVEAQGKYIFFRREKSWLFGEQERDQELRTKIAEIEKEMG